MADKKFCYVFPGQGSQSVGMGYTLAEKFPEFEIILNETLREADASVGFSLSSILKNGPAEKLRETDITQPGLLAVSTAMGRWLKAQGKKADFATGHSLGEYSALVYAEALKFQDAVKLVHLRGQLMQNAVPSGQGGMAALIGATPESAAKLCEHIQKQTGKVLEISVLNSPGQVVVSGNIEAIEASMKIVKEFGIRFATQLEVSGPFHCSLLKDAGRKLREALNKTEIHEPRIPVMSNVTAKVQNQPDEIRSNLEAQVFKTVRWEDCVRAVADQGTKDFVEVGSGKVLAGIIKKISAEINVTCVDALSSMDELKSL